MFVIYEKDEDDNIVSTIELNGKQVVSITKLEDESDRILVRCTNGRVYNLPASGIDIVEDSIGGGGGGGGTAERPTDLNETIDLLMDNIG